MDKTYAYPSGTYVIGSHDVYRTRTRPTWYRYRRWKAWTDWVEGTAPTATNDKQVETRPAAPEPPTIEQTEQTIINREVAYVGFSKPDNAVNYRVEVYENGTLINDDITANQYWLVYGSKIGKYEVYITPRTEDGRFKAASRAKATVNVVVGDYIPVKQITYNNHVYSIYDISTSWNAARDIAEQMGGHLVTLNNVAEYNEVVKLLPAGAKEAYWIGATDRGSEGSWRWYNKEEGLHLPWDTGEPNNAANGPLGTDYFANFAEIHKNGKLNDTTNMPEVVRSMGFIVEVEDYSSRPTAEYNGKTFIRFDDIEVGTGSSTPANHVTFEDAKLFAQRIGGHLATITSLEEQRAVAKLASEGSKNAYLIGAAKSDSWAWLTGEAWDYTHWGSSQPGSQSYGAINKDGSWAASAGDGTSANLGFIVEIEADKTQTTNAETLIDHKWMLVEHPMTYMDALAYAKTLGTAGNPAHLATVDTAEEQEAVRRLVAQGAGVSYWINGSSFNSDGIFKLSNGKLMNYFNWQAGQPDGNSGSETGLGKFIYVTGLVEGSVTAATGKWNDAANKYASGFVVEWDAFKIGGDDWTPCDCGCKKLMSKCDCIDCGEKDCGCGKSIKDCDCEDCDIPETPCHCGCGKTLKDCDCEDCEGCHGGDDDKLCTACDCGHTEAQCKALGCRPCSPRPGGKNRIETAVLIAQKGWPTGADTVILANGSNFPDALAGVPLSKVLDAPILLTMNGAYGIEAIVIDCIKNDMKAKTVVILGGSASVSEGIEDYLEQSGFEVVRYAGSNRYKTAIAISNAMEAEGKIIDKAFICDGLNFPDALAAGPAAALMGKPVLFQQSSDTENISPDTKAYLLEKNVDNVYVIGGSSSVSSTVEGKLKSYFGVQRVSGSNRYDTSVQIYKSFSGLYQKQLVTGAAGITFSDALAGAAYAAKYAAPLFLMQNNYVHESVKAAIVSIKPEKFVVFGGEGSLNDITVVKYLDQYEKTYYYEEDAA
ncbi:MAG: cell wall-binding repeat-containing protein [Oscillospiraceae bacterium]|jgi:putative cell wall-binding protein|nr:cell wall-binding repeat-containing protein [Oscillospiraceae bacterium]